MYPCSRCLSYIAIHLPYIFQKTHLYLPHHYSSRVSDLCPRPMPECARGRTANTLLSATTSLRLVAINRNSIQGGWPAKVKPITIFIIRNSNRPSTLRPVSVSNLNFDIQFESPSPTNQWSIWSFTIARKPQDLWLVECQKDQSQNWKDFECWELIQLIHGLVDLWIWTLVAPC